jgi:hypothetical protein
MWFPVRTRSYIRQESQFKYHHPDARATNMEIADSTSTIRTPAPHGPDARIADMEIVCLSSAVRTLIPHGPDVRSLIWKLLATNVRPFERQCLTVRTRLLNRKDFQRNSQKILLHCCRSERPRFTVETASVHISAAVAHSAPQPINRGPWALRTARIRY